MLFFGQSQRRIRRERADRIIDFNAAFAGGKDGKDLFDSLSKEE